MSMSIGKPATSPPIPPTIPDPIVDRLSIRATDLSRSIVNPITLSKKLRESLTEIAGPAANAYHIGLSYDGTSSSVKVEIAYLGPHLVAELIADAKSADLSVAYTRTTDNGWKVAVGLTASKSFHPPTGSGIVASFAVTITK